MNIKKIRPIFFSPTFSTSKVALEFSAKLATNLNVKTNPLNITSQQNRKQVLTFSDSDLLVLALPVYGGRIPLVVEDFLNNLEGAETPAVIIALYGNRAYDDALLEMKNILESRRFNVWAGAAFLGKHSMNEKLAAGRPNPSDLLLAKDFADKVAKKVLSKNPFAPIFVNGNSPYVERKPKPSLAPKTTDTCYNCQLCVKGCPVGAISSGNPKNADANKCILCHACVKVCPVKAKYFDSEFLDAMRIRLETHFLAPKQPEFFI